MAEHTHIEWTEATWNPITGCSVTSPGCTNCYAMALAGTRLADHPSRAGLTQPSKAGPVWTGEVRLNEQWLDQPLRWKRPRMIFVCAHGDLFHEAVPDEWIDRVFAVMALCPQHTFQVLTKRSARMRDYLNARGGHGDTPGHHIMHAMDGITRERWPQLSWPLSNIWLGVSVEDQARADERIPDLLATPAAVRWISAEPLLGPVDLRHLPALIAGVDRPLLRTDALHGKHHCGAGWSPVQRLDWVVVGGESGKGARPMHPDWARSLRDQCAAADVPFFFKQWGEWFPYGELDADGHQNSRTRGEQPGLWHTWANGGGFSVKIGKRRAGRLLDGKLHDATPRAAEGRDNA